MITINSTQARKKIYHLIDQVNLDHEPIQITGKRNNAVLIAEDDWTGINETLYLPSFKGMAESIEKGINTDTKDCTEKSPW